VEVVVVVVCRWSEEPNSHSKSRSCSRCASSSRAVRWPR